MIGMVIIFALVAACVLFGLWRRNTDGNFRELPQPESTFAVADESEDFAEQPASDQRLTADDIGAQLGQRATLVQFSSAFCAPCRATKQVLRRVSDDLDGVASIEVDAEQHLDLTRRLSILRTPTVLVLDADGVIRHRAAGLPRYPDVVAAVATVV